MSVGIFPVTDDGLRIARLIESGIEGCRVYSPSELKRGGLSRRVREAFKVGLKGIVFVSAVGIAVRTVAPFIKDKSRDPAVVVVDDTGRFVVSLLSGHLGGANRLARCIAELLNATPVITTATDSRGLSCVEDMAETFSLAIENLEGTRYVNSAIIKNKKVYVVDRNRNRLSRIKDVFTGKGPFVFTTRIPMRLEDGGAVVVISTRYSEVVDDSILQRTVFLKPKEFVVGMGCDRGVSVREVEDAFIGVLREADISPLSVRNIASIDLKRDEKGLVGLARKYNLRIEFFSRERLKGVRLPSGVSVFVKERIGIGGVCEPSALLSAGTQRIWRRKKKVGRVTVAIARVPYTSWV